MSNALPDFDLLRPQSVEEAVAALQTSPSARLCAGGTDLIVNMRHGLVELETLVDLGAVVAMKRLEADAAGLHIGAGVTLRDLAESEAVSESYTAIRQAALAVAGPGHRAVATVGGNLCLETRCLYYNQSHWWRKANDFCLKYRGETCHVAPTGNRCRAAFCGDLAPALMVFGAKIEIAGPNGIRRIALPDLYREDGADHLTLAACEIITAIHIAPSKAKSGYAKVRIRGAIDFPLAGVAIACERGSPSARSFRIAVTGTNSCPLLLDGPAPLADGDDPDAYFGALNKLVQKAVSPQRTTTTGAHYRRLAVAALAARLAKELVDG
ncbi:MAG: 4-hydroxybenzoyl-CoA reductase subunit beta [Proteobacteria bacterium]|nr:4-hydroxybenzoyl-CoA reductase subunit beta [Pseudomonadota bacterium]